MRLFFTALFFSFTFSTMANVPPSLYTEYLSSDYKVTPSENLPMELRYLIKSISQYQLTDLEKTAYIESLILLDAHTKALSKEEIFFLGKSEILKSLFKGRIKKKAHKRSHNPKILIEIKAWSEAGEISIFTKWFLEALHADLKNQFDSPFFRQFMLFKIANKRIRELELRKLEKRFSLLLPWYQEYKEKGPEIFQQELKPILINTLSHISMYYGLLAKYSKLNNQLQLNNFKKLASLRIEPLNKIQKEELSLLPLFPNLDPNYLPPEVLPEPVDTWIPMDDMKNFKAKLSGELFPKVNPNYKAPEKLPEPVNDWLLEL